MTHSQPAFWLKITPDYVIQNFEALLNYVSSYTYIKEDESEDGNFTQTYRYIKAVSDNYAKQISEKTIYDDISFDIPVKKVIRILAATILTGKKMGINDFDNIKALVNLLTITNHDMPADCERRMFEIVKNCICHVPVESYTFAWKDLKEENFMTGTFENKFSNTVFSTETPDEVYIYEHKGCILIEKGSITLSSVNHHKSIHEKLETELESDLDIKVKTIDASKKPDTDDLFNSLPAICGEFDQMKHHEVKLKRYNDTEPIPVRVKRINGIKVEVETIDPEYEYETGNIYIDNFVMLYSRQNILDNLRPGSYLPAVRSDGYNPQTPFRIDKEWMCEYVKDRFETARENEELFTAIHFCNFTGGTRWLTEDGLFVNVFDNELSSVSNDIINDAMSTEKGCVVCMHSFSDENTAIKGRIIETAPLVPVTDMKEFECNALNRFIRDFLEDVESSVQIEPDNGPQIQYMTREDASLLTLLVYQLALKTNTKDSYYRVSDLIISLLLSKISDSTHNYDFISCQLDYQKNITSFASGKSPSTLRLAHNGTMSDIRAVANADEIIDTLRNYKDITVHNEGLKDNVTLNTMTIDDVKENIADLVKASNILIGRIDDSEIDRIKKIICSRLDVDDMYVSSAGLGTYYGMESEFLEFKASCVLPPYDCRTNVFSKDVEYQKWNILKAICAFLNSASGGELLIGVSDSGYATGLDNDINTLYQHRLIGAPNADRLRTYLQMFIDRSFATVDNKADCTAITAGRVFCKIEQDDKSREIIRIKIEPYPWNVVKIIADNKPARFHNIYVRSSGASTPILSGQGIRDITARKINSMKKDDHKLALIYDAIDNRRVITISDYDGKHGHSTRNLEPYKILDNNKYFLAYDIDKKGVRIFKLARMTDSDITITNRPWQNMKKHKKYDADMFGMIESTPSEREEITLLLSNRAKILLAEEYDIYPNHEKALTKSNTDTSYPWTLHTTINNPAGIGRFIMGLPGEVKVLSGDRLKGYIDNQRRLPLW